VGKDRSRTPLEPLAERVRRTGSGATTIMAPLMSTSRAAIPEALTLEPSGSIPSSLSVTHRIQRSSSDMILESDTEATPPSGSDKGVAGENKILDGDTRPP